MVTIPVLHRSKTRLLAQKQERELPTAYATKEMPERKDSAGP